MTKPIRIQSLLLVGASVLFSTSGWSQDLAQQLEEPLKLLVPPQKLTKTTSLPMFDKRYGSIQERRTTSAEQRAAYVISFQKSVVYMDSNHEVLLEREYLGAEERGYVVSSINGKFVLVVNLAMKRFSLQDDTGHVLWEMEYPQGYLSRPRQQQFIITPSGQVIVPLTGCSHFYKCASEKKVEVYDTNGTKHELPTLANGDFIAGSFSISPEGDFLLVSSSYLHRSHRIRSLWRMLPKHWDKVSGKVGSRIGFYHLRNKREIWQRDFLVPIRYNSSSYVTSNGEYAICVSGRNVPYSGESIMEYQYNGSFYIFDREGQILKEIPLSEWQLTGMTIQDVSPDENFIAVSGRAVESPGQQEGKGNPLVAVVETTTGDVLWRKTIDIGYRTPVMSVCDNARLTAMAFDQVYPDRRTLLLVFDKKGNRVFERQVAEKIGFLQLSDDGRLLWLTDKDDHLHLVEVRI